MDKATPKFYIKSSLTELNIKNFSELLVMIAAYDNKQWAASTYITTAFTRERFGELVIKLGECIRDNVETPV